MLIRNGRQIVLLTLLCVLLGQPVSNAEVGPRPPCGTDTIPPYPSLGEPATIKVWSKSELADSWSPSPCTGWSSSGFTTLVSITARFRKNGTEDLLRHIGAVSQLRGLRYWSVTHKEWQTLIVDAYALTGDQPSRGRGDFEPSEMTAGSVLYYEQVDNRSGRAIYRLHILEVSADRIIVEVENASTIHYLLLPLFRPAELQSIYFLDRESQDTWRYFGMTRTARSANRVLVGNESSAVNRAVAFYRHMVGIPTNQEPPTAR